VDALILASGSDLFTPDQGINPYGYGRIPGVVTSLEFERMLSAAGPGRTKLVHPVTGRQIQRIAWFQCVGSRDLTYGNPFCSSVCCMISIKQSMLAKTLYPQVADACVFYMDMRTPGKDSELYADQARQAGVNFVRARVHSLAPDATDPFAGIHVRWTDLSGKMCENRFDLVVLAVGQNPDTMMQAFAGDHDIDTDAWGFVESASFAPADTSRPGIFACGTVTGPKDIQASVIQASAAAMSAMETMAAAGRRHQQPLPWQLSSPGSWWLCASAMALWQRTWICPKSWPLFAGFWHRIRKWSRYRWQTGCVSLRAGRCWAKR